MKAVRILGPFDVVEDGRHVALGGPRQQRVLALLALEANRAVPLDSLIDGVWGDDAPAAAVRTVRAYLSRLHAALGPGMIATGRGGYVLQVDGDALDAARFQRLAGDGRQLLARREFARAHAVLTTSLGLWRGDVLQGMERTGSIATAGSHLEELRLTALEDRIAADLDLGHHRGLVPELTTLVARQPLRERLWAQLMLALYRCDRQADALTASRRVRGMLADELGLEPGPALQALERSILRQEVAEPAAAPPRVAATAVGLQSATTEPGALERRVVVALVTDLSRVQATLGLSDVEDVHHELRSVVAVVAAAVGAAGGILVQRVGEVVVALFGTRRAHHDEVDRAVRTALAIRAAMQGRNPPIPIRIGIELGEMLVDMSLARGVDDVAVAGDLVSTAARLQSAALSSEILLGPVAQALTSAPLGERRDVHGAAEAPLPASPVAGPPLSPSHRPMVQTGFAGRDEELGALESALADAVASGDPRMVHVIGPPGIGKSRLLREFSTRPERTAYWIACAPAGEITTAAALLNLLTPDLDAEVGVTGNAITALTRAHAARVGEERDPARVAEILAITAGLHEASVDDRSLIWSGRADEAQGAWRAYLTGVLRTSAWPVVLIIDDVHWAASDMRELLVGTLFGLHGPLLVLLAAWEEHSLMPWGEGRAATTLTLDGLDATGARAIALASGAPADAVEEIVTRAGGNALYLETVARNWGTLGVPLGVRGAVTARLDALPQGLRELVGAASVLGGHVEPEALGALTARDRQAADADCQALVEEWVLISAETGGFAFRHQLLSAAAYLGLTKRERTRLHTRAAEWHAAQESPDASELARHWDAAGDAVAAVGAYQSAAGRAMRRMEVHEAERLLARATELSEGDAEVSSAVWLARGHVLFACGQATAAREAFGRSLVQAPASDSARRSRALSGRATMTFWDLDLDAAEVDATAAQRLARRSGSDAILAEAQAALALVRSAQGRPAEALRLANSARALAARCGLPGMAAMAGMVGVLVHHHAGHSAHAATLVDDVAADCRTEGLPVALVWALFKGGLAHAALGQFTGAQRCWNELEAVARKTGNATFLAETANCRGHLARELGDLAQADEHDHACLAVAVPLSADEAVANALMNLVAGTLARGDLDAARQRLDEAVPFLSARAWYRWRYSLRYRYYRSRLLVAQGALDEARTLTRESMVLGRRAGIGKNTLRPALMLAEIRALDEPDAAVADFARIGARARAAGLRPIAWRAYAAGACLADQRRSSAAARLRSAAVRELRLIERGVPDAALPDFRRNVAAPVEAGRPDAHMLPL